MKNEFLEQMQSFIAETAIGASALRNQGVEDLIQHCRDYCKKVDLNKIPDQADAFTEWLDAQTEALMQGAPEGATENFGAARKALNLFLRSAAYNVTLNTEYDLDKLLPVLEIPLDSYAAMHLKAHDKALSKKWVGLKYVTRAEHSKYQLSAPQLAKQWQVNRVDLDVFFYRKEVSAG